MNKLFRFLIDLIIIGLMGTFALFLLFLTIYKNELWNTIDFKKKGDNKK